MRIKIQLRDLVRSDAAIRALGLNPWCVAEGANGDDWYEIDLEDALTWGVIRP